jgi:hypothetical protein
MLKNLMTPKTKEMLALHEEALKKRAAQVEPAEPNEEQRLRRQRKIEEMRQRQKRVIG